MHNTPEGITDAPWNEPETKRVEFNFRGIMFELDVIAEKGRNVAPIFSLEAVYHKGEDISEAIDKSFVDIEDHYNEVVRAEFMDQTRR